MQIKNTQEQVREQVKLWRAQGLNIGFVPTMGALHHGHLRLVKQAQAENDKVAVSVFVNPVQFNNPDDLKTYPRILEADIALLERVGCDMVFAPTAEEMYPEGEEPKLYDLGGLDKVMEGAFRPGHFQGVVLVVDKLLRMFMPHKAYFGKKDYQQLAIIKYMVQQKGLPVEIVPVPIVREADGLAMSSRNRRLLEEHRAIAPSLHKSLQWIASQKAVQTVKVLESKASAFLEVQGFKVDYVSIVDRNTLQVLDPGSKAAGAVVCLAAYLGDVRLIDNMEI